MGIQQFACKWIRLQEILVTTAVGWVPTIGLGVVLRRLFYRTIFKQMGTSVFIEDGVELICPSRIEIGDEVKLLRYVRLNNGSSNSRICIRDGVCLERAVFTTCFAENTCVEIGERTLVGQYTCIAGPGNVKIGKDCLIAAYSGIYANTHIYADPTQKFREQGIISKGVVIEDDCWLGHGVTILDGVTIGQGSLIGAGAVVTKDIPPYSVAVGVPARLLRSRKPSYSMNSKEKNLDLTFAHHSPKSQ